MWKYGYLFSYAFPSYDTEGQSSSCELCPSFSRVFRFFKCPSIGFALLLVLTVAYLPFSSSLFLSRWYLVQGCTAVHCDSAMRDLHGLRNISRIHGVVRNIDYSNRCWLLYFITLEWFSCRIAIYLRFSNGNFIFSKRFNVIPYIINFYWDLLQFVWNIVHSMPNR